jgi:hypothetical protein
MSSPSFEVSRYDHGKRQRACSLLISLRCVSHAAAPTKMPPTERAGFQKRRHTLRIVIISTQIRN